VLQSVARQPYYRQQHPKCCERTNEWRNKGKAGDGMGEGSGMRSRGDKRRLATGGRIGMKGGSLILPKV